MRATWVAASLILFYNAIDGRLRKGQISKAMRFNFAEAGTSLLLLAIQICCLGVLLLGGSASWTRAAAGMAFMAMGIALRTCAIRTLGIFYTRRLMVQNEQSLIRSGPFRWIRHPGYAGTLLMWSGAAATSGRMIVSVLVTLLMVLAYAIRIRREERMLGATLAGYEHYRTTTAALIPWLL